MFCYAKCYFLEGCDGKTILKLLYKHHIYRYNISYITLIFNSVGLIVFNVTRRRTVQIYIIEVHMMLAVRKRT